MAHAGGADGLDLVRRIIAGAAAHLAPGGGLLCEIGEDREVLEAEFPDAAFLWLDSAESEGEVFWVRREDIPLPEQGEGGMRSMPGEGALRVKLR